MTHILDILNAYTLLCDGAMGTRVQTLDLDREKDYWGKENCTEILVLSRPDAIRTIHKSYFEAGADIVETNSFGGSPLTLAEFSLEDQAFTMNKRAGELAQEAREMFCDGRVRFVVGSVGPGTRLPTLGQIDYESLEEGLCLQCQGLLAGGIDAFLIETCQDPLQIKAAVNGAKRAQVLTRKTVPIFVQVTVEWNKTLLVGTDITAAATIIESLQVDLLGMNCATGPQEMVEQLQWLSQNWSGFLSCQPNAGLPELINGHTHYPLPPEALAFWLERFVTECHVHVIGGCCGTTPQHIQALDTMLRRLGKEQYRPQPIVRQVYNIPSVASLYTQVPFHQENAYFSIGERCNANGSKKWRCLQEQQDWDGCVGLAREQEKEGSHALDVCTAFVGRDEVKDMDEVIRHFVGTIEVPLVIDTTEYDVLKRALCLYGGKPIINSINFEEGEEQARKCLELARRFGCAVIGLTIDEDGMAKTPEKKLHIAQRLYDLVVKEYRLPASDLLIDPLTFTIATGNEDDRQLGLWTLQGIERIAHTMPECQMIIGLSNISFGLQAAARQVLNSVFLEHGLRKGLTGAIVHVSKILPLHQISEKEVKIAEDLIYDRRVEGYDPLSEFLSLFEGRHSSAQVKRDRLERVEDRLKQRIIDGDRQGIEEDLSLALQQYTALEIINTLLLDGMKVVGDLFGAAKMQLPFVLQSAETMKRAVTFLEGFMEKDKGQTKATIVLATVRGDVHDIGKNLVDIILTNNRYRVVNLGIKQPLENIVGAVKEYGADAVGMSGLLVKSTVVMRENLEQMTKQGIDIPVLLGGAALTKKYVEEDCVRSYECGRVAYARDAFDGLWLMDKITQESFDGYLQEIQQKREGLKFATGKRKRRKEGRGKKVGGREFTRMRNEEKERLRERRGRLSEGVEVPDTPFLGSCVMEQISPWTLLQFLNERVLYQFHWGYKKQGKSLGEYEAWSQEHLRPVLYRLMERVMEEEILWPRAIYGYWPCVGDGNALIVFDKDRRKECMRLVLPRQEEKQEMCIADYFRDITSGEQDILGIQIVTMGERAAQIERRWLAEDRYEDYLYLHGLSVEMTEALAEYVHARIRKELGFGGEEERVQGSYRGSRYSFGYPACPNLSDQKYLLEILDAGRIGVVLSEEDQLHPEQSTSALVVHHPQAKYFSL